MVVGGDSGEGVGGADDTPQHQYPHQQQKKFLVARSREQKNSIFDYVHLSTALLRKVRFGQPIELAIQLDELQHGSGRDDAFIVYHRVVRFQAADGGYLLVESDGCLRKVPRERASDPRTLVTLFPRDPRASCGKTPKRVCSGDCVFLVHGSEASLHSQLGVSQADSDEMMDGPRSLMNEVARHDAVAAQSVDPHDLQRQQHVSGAPPLSKKSIRQKQLGQALTPDADAMPTTLWRLVQVPDGVGAHPGAELSVPRDDCLRHGARCHIFQNRNVVCYEIPVLKHNDAGGGGPSARLSRSDSQPPESQEELSPRSSAPETTAASSTHLSTTVFAHVWLQAAPTPSLSYHPSSCQCLHASDAAARGKSLWDNTWQICDVGTLERQDASRRVRQALRKKLPAPFALEVEKRQCRAARTIVRFFRRFVRDALVQSRAPDALRCRRHLHSPTRTLPAEVLTASEQLKLLQCYNPHVYGGGRAPPRPRRGLASVANATSSAGADRHALAAMKCGVDSLSREWLRTETVTRLSAASTAAATYSRRPLSSPLTPQRLRTNRERERQFLVEMKMTAGELPSFRFGARPHTAPLAAIGCEAQGTGR